VASHIDLKVTHGTSGLRWNTTRSA